MYKIKIPRRIICLNPAGIELHGFCDASEQGYGACIYVRSVNLFCAKSRLRQSWLSVGQSVLHICDVLHKFVILSRVREKQQLGIKKFLSVITASAYK